MTSTLSGLFQLMRPKQWVKNGFVLAPLVFSGLFTDLNALLNAIVAMMLFCFASSATYIINDYRDIENDRKHPVKRHKRPLASGAVQKPQALMLLFVLYAVLIANAFVAPAVLAVIMAYMLLNLAYTFKLKHMPVLDIFSIAFGFVLRVLAGAVALDVPLSGWMFITTLCLALYLAAIKRKQELSLQGDKSRKVLKKYTLQLVNRYAEMSAVGSLLFYSLFVLTDRPELVITIPFVLFGLFRYWFIVDTQEGGESPTDALYSDWQLLACISCWILTCLWAVWPTDLGIYLPWM